MRSVADFDVHKATQTQNNMSFEAPVIGSITGGVLDRSHTDIAECAGPQACPPFFAGALRKSALGPVP
jgi:hypothetical protein